MKRWFLKYGLDILLLIILAGLFLWIYLIAQGNNSNKPGWLLLPITGIYVVVSVYMAAGSIAAARASQKSVEVMEQTLNEMRLSRQIQYSPWFTYPDGYRVLLSDDGQGHMKLRNLFKVPVGQLSAMLWELEDGFDTKTVKYSSMRESKPSDFSEEETDIIIEMQPSLRTDEEKLMWANLALKDFTDLWHRQPLNSLCVIAYNIAGEAQRRFILLDLELAREDKHLRDVIRELPTN